MLVYGGELACLCLVTCVVVKK